MPLGLPQVSSSAPYNLHSRSDHFCPFSPLGTVSPESVLSRRSRRGTAAVSWAQEGRLGPSVLQGQEPLGQIRALCTSVSPWPRAPSLEAQGLLYLRSIKASNLLQPAVRTARRPRISLFTLLGGFPESEQGRRGRKLSAELAPLGPRMGTGVSGFLAQTHSGFCWDIAHALE